MASKGNNIGAFRYAFNYATSSNFRASVHGNGFDQIPDRNLKETLIKLEKITRGFTKKDIGGWRKAWQFASSSTLPKRSELYDIYQDSLIDNHLSGAISNRTLKLLKRKFVIVDADSGEVDKDKTKLFRRKWFKDFLKFSHSHIYWGHSLIQFGDIIDGEFKSVVLVNRYHVKPERGFIVRHQFDDFGVSFRDEPLSDFVLEVGSQFDLGLLLKAAPQAIAKKNMFGFWEEFGEIFGMPIRIATSPTKDKGERSTIENMLDKMGVASWGLFPEGTTIEIKESQQRDAFEVYDERISRANSEMSKLILGQTMSMDDGSSQSQATVHQEVAKDVTDADAEDTWFLINDELIPFMIKHGYDLEGSEFRWDDTTELSFEEQLEVDIFLTANFEIDLKYYIDKYKVPITGPKLNPTSAQDITNFLMDLKKKRMLKA